jgi:hypothetical protein
MSLQIEDFKRRHADNADLKGKIYGELRNAGTKDYKAICGVCGGNDLSVSKSKPVSNCFNGCGFKGDDIDYLQKVKGLSFHEALTEIVQLAGENPEDFHQMDEKAIAQMQMRKKKLELAEELISIFSVGLLHSSKAKAYLNERKITIAEAQTAKIGYLDKSNIGEINALLHKNELPTLGNHFCDRLAIPITNSPLGVLDFQFRTLEKDVQPKYMNMGGTSKDDFSGLSSVVKNARQLIVTESHFEAAIQNSRNRLNKSEEVWLSLGGCSLTEKHLKDLTRIVKENNIQTLTFMLDGDTPGFNAITKILEPQVLKVVRPIFHQMCFFSWDKLASPKLKDIFDLMREHGYFYLDAVNTYLRNDCFMQNVFEYLVSQCFGKVIILDYREQELGIQKLLYSISALNDKDKVQLDLALSDRFKDSPYVLDRVRARVAEEFEKIEEERYVNSVKDCVAKAKDCTKIEQIDILLESLPKKEILSIPVHPEPLTDNDWASTTELIPTYYDALDKTVGLTPGGLGIVGGRPGEGKSTFSLNLLRSQLLGRSESRCLFISLEETQKALNQKLLLCDSDVILDDNNIEENYKNFLQYLKYGKFQQNGKMVTLDKEKAEKIEMSKLWINQCISEKRLAILSPKYTDIDDIVKEMLGYNKYFGYDFICLDYLQLVTSTTTKEQNYLLGKAIANKLARFALDTGCVLLAGSQLNRKISERHDSRPVLSDLRESGDYEQKTCLAIGLSTPNGITSESSQEEKDKLEVTIMKNREGICSDYLTLSFKRSTRRILNRFRDY